MMALVISAMSLVGTSLPTHAQQQTQEEQKQKERDQRQSEQDEKQQQQRVQQEQKQDQRQQQRLSQAQQKQLINQQHNVWRITVSIWNSRSVSHNRMQHSYNNKGAWRSTVFRNST
jgi:hypothetical protein